FQEAGGSYMVDERVSAARMSGDQAVVADVLLRRAASSPFFSETKWRAATQALEIARRLGDREQIGKALLALGLMEIPRGGYALARDRFLEARAVFESLDDRKNVLEAVVQLERIASKVDDL